MADYNQLKSDAVTEYLKSGGSQANVDAYFAANPAPDYNQLASNAAQWYAGQPEPSQGGISNTDVRNQRIGSYFGVAAPQAGSNYDYSGGGLTGATPGGSTVTPPITYPGGWEETFKKLAPAVQQAIQSRYGNMTPEQIMQDWAQNVAPQYAQGTSTEDILGGKGIRLPPNLTANAMTPGNARMSREYDPTGIAGYRDAGDSYYAALKDNSNRVKQDWEPSTGGSGLQSAVGPDGRTMVWDAKDGFGVNAMTMEDYQKQHQAPQMQAQQWDPSMYWGQQPSQQYGGQQPQQQTNPNWYYQGYNTGGTNDPMVVQNAIANQSDPNSMAGLFKNLTNNFNSMQQQQGGSKAIMSSLDAPPQQKGGF